MIRNLAILVVLLGAVPATARADVEVSVSLSTFEAPLAVHGEWVVAGPYGRVWHPHHVAVGWRPYLDGRWEWTDDGWLWVSDEPWAWATYHYGRWAWEPGWGWVWVPGYEWAPAWVEWRYSEGCVGWAPLFPAGLRPGPVVYEHWTFVPSRSFVGVRAWSVAWSPDRVREHWRTTTPAPGWHEARHDRVAYGTPTVHRAEPAFGPPRTFVEREVGHAVQSVRPVNVGSPAEIGRRHDAPEIYRPMPGERRSPAAYPAPPERRDARRDAPPAVGRPEQRPAPVRPEVQPSPARPVERPMVNRPEPLRQAPRPAMDRGDPGRAAPRPREMFRSEPQRSAPPAMRQAPGVGPTVPNPVVQKPQPKRRTGGQEARHRR